MSRQKVWDLPTRIFHWSLVGSVVFAFVTGQAGGNWIEWHGRTGLFILGLLAFRIVWGFIGSPTACFAHFVRGPSAIRAYLRGEWRGVGHNPLGALAVLTLLAMTSAQVVTGLFANDDIAFAGPLAALVSSELSGQITGLHVLIFNGLLALVILHVAAIAFYARVKRTNLVLPMITGYQEQGDVQPAPVRHFCFRLASFLAACIIAAAVVYAGAGGFIEVPPLPVFEQSAAPTW